MNIQEVQPAEWACPAKRVSDYQDYDYMIYILHSINYYLKIEL